jgi:hypothetical protein
VAPEISEISSCLHRFGASLVFNLAEIDPKSQKNRGLRVVL